MLDLEVSTGRHFWPGPKSGVEVGLVQGKPALRLVVRGESQIVMLTPDAMEALADALDAVVDMAEGTPRAALVV